MEAKRRREMFCLQRYAPSILGICFMISWMMVVGMIGLREVMTHTTCLSVDITYYLCTFAMVMFRWMRVTRWSMGLHISLYSFAQMLSIMRLYYDDGDKFVRLYAVAHYGLLVLYIVQIVYALLRFGPCYLTDAKNETKAVHWHCFCGLLTFVIHTWNFLLQLYLWHWSLVVVGQMYVLLMLFIILTPYFEASHRRAPVPRSGLNRPRAQASDLSSISSADPPWIYAARHSHV